MTSDTAGQVVLLLVAVATLAYPIAVKAFMAGWTSQEPRTEHQTALRTSLIALAIYISWSNLVTDEHSALMWALLFIGMAFPVIAFTFITGAVGEMIVEWLIPDFKPKPMAPPIRPAEEEEEEDEDE